MVKYPYSINPESYNNAKLLRNSVYDPDSASCYTNKWKVRFLKTITLGRYKDPYYEIGIEYWFDQYPFMRPLWEWPDDRPPEYRIGEGNTTRDDKWTHEPDVRGSKRTRGN